MIFENTGLDGLHSDLAYLDECAEKVGFIRWQWEYYRATYDLKIEDKKIRLNTSCALTPALLKASSKNRTPSSKSKRYTWVEPRSHTDLSMNPWLHSPL